MAIHRVSGLRLEADIPLPELPRASAARADCRFQLLALEDLTRTRPDYVPRLSPWGLARRTLLTLCDGRRPLAEIESELCRRHPELFASPAAAAGFVAEVVTRYA